MTHKEPLPNTAEAFLRGNLIQRKLPVSLDDLAQQESLSVSELPSRLAQHVQSITAYYAAKPFNANVLDDALNPQIDFLYRIWHTSRNITPDHPFYSFARTLDSFEGFADTHLSHLTSNTHINLAKRINQFIYTTMHKQKLLEICSPEFPRYSTSGEYNTQGEWVRIPKHLTSETREEYVDKQILEEVISLRNKLTDEPLLFHSTGSASLDGIGQHEALLSSTEASLGHTPLKTGEIYEAQGTRRTLGSVYAAENMHRGYSLARWFDEYHVTFGISLSAQEAFLQKKYPDRVIDVTDWMNEGITIGPRVPLQHIRTVLVDFVQKGAMQTWADKYCPQALVISYEAFEILRRENISSEFADPRQTAEELLQQPRIHVA